MKKNYIIPSSTIYEAFLSGNMIASSLTNGGSGTSGDKGESRDYNEETSTTTSDNNSIWSDEW